MLDAAVAMRGDDDHIRALRFYRLQDLKVRFPSANDLAGFYGTGDPILDELRQFLRTAVSQFFFNAGKAHLSETEISRIDGRFHHVHQDKFGPKHPAERYSILESVLGVAGKIDRNEDTFQCDG